LKYVIFQMFPIMEALSDGAVKVGIPRAISLG
jgi:hypothetical protein